MTSTDRGVWSRGGEARGGLVVGLGVRRSAAAADVLRAIDDARTASGVAGEPVTALATWSECADRGAILQVASHLGCPTTVIDTDVLRDQPVSHRSACVERLTACERQEGPDEVDGGRRPERTVSSVAEAAARAAVGPSGRMLLARHVGVGCVVSLARASAAADSAGTTPLAGLGSPPSCADAGGDGPVVSGATTKPPPAPDLDHHGDSEVTPGLLDFAVNVAVPRPPDWLANVLREAVAGLAAYPDVAAATHALAGSLGVDPESVLLLNGAAEGFTLVARATTWRRPLVIHPQFTEPEAALRDAGHHVHRHVLDVSSHFVLRPADVDARADLVVLGNPTNPTSRLHARHDVLALRRAGRLVLVDEAFMDVVDAHELESVVRDACEQPGLLVLRSLTKTFGLAGLRAGYAVGHPDEIARLRRVQQPWSVNSLALAAVRACSEPGSATAARAAAHTAEVVEAMRLHRPRLVATLERHGLAVVPQPAGPFVLATHPDAAALRLRLRERGVACRRGDTFPGLGAEWLRFAVRDEEAIARLDVSLADAGVGAGSDRGYATGQEAS